jgi:hypothetical protein
MVHASRKALLSSRPRLGDHGREQVFIRRRCAREDDVACSALTANDAAKGVPMPEPVTVTIRKAELHNRFDAQLGDLANLQPLEQSVRNRLNAQFPAVQVQSVTAEMPEPDKPPGGQGMLVIFTITYLEGNLIGWQVKDALV